MTVKRTTSLFGIIALIAIIGFSMLACDNGGGGGGGGLLPAPKLVVTLTGNIINISWTPIAGASGYKFYARAKLGSAVGDWDSATITETSDVVDASDYAGYTFEFKVAAISANGTEGVMSNTATVTIPGSSSGLPAPTGLTATATSSTSITLTWNAVSGAASYNVYASLSASSGFTNSRNTASSPYVATDGTPNTTYYFKVAAVSSSGTEGPMSSVVSATTLSGSNTGLPAPTGLTATATSSSTVSLSWNAVSGAAGYDVYYSTSASGNYNYDWFTTSTSYNVTGLSAGTTYYFKISAYDSSLENGAMSNYVSATTPSGNSGGLAAPTGLTATNTADGISLTWNAVSGAASYNVYASLSALEGYQKLGNTTSTSQTITGASSGTTYYFKVAAVSSSGTEGAMSNYVSATASGGSGGDGTTFTTVSAMSTWLGSQAANSPVTPYIVKLNVSSLSGAGAALRSNPNKYVFLDLSGSTFTTIPGDAFGSNSSNLVSTSLVGVTIPNSVTSIGNNAFRGTSLTSVTIPNSVTSLGSSVFENCKSLTSATIGSGVTTIGNYAFRGCTSLNDLTIPNSVTIIGQYAFSDCTALTSVTIPNSVTAIQSSAFNACTGLISVTFTATSKVTTIQGSAFYGCTSLTSIIIPNSVTNIGTGAFRNCTSLTSVTIGSSVTDIGDTAFYSCSSLTTVRFEGTSATWVSSSFYNAGSGATGLQQQYNNGGVGTYTRSGSTWTKSS